MIDGKIGDEFDVQTLATLTQLGRKRFDARCPPGWADSKKKWTPPRVRLRISRGQ
ncbi:hypothetical protein K7711_44235 [Nocardia sp. CA2R105]|uniref:PIN-like domain-containing protein n=1 Tax=Nocardia coffeae TaxID=2873381 RepID=UPI001CA7B1A3|nr:hypothetical protein [Nocardia coffeae]